MIFLKTEDEIELLRKSNLLVGKTLAEIAKVIQPGVTTAELDKVAEEFIRDNGAEPTFKGYPNPYGGVPFPASVCTSVNGQVVHGVPGNVVLKDLAFVECKGNHFIEICASRDILIENCSFSVQQANNNTYGEMIQLDVLEPLSFHHFRDNSLNNATYDGTPLDNVVIRGCTFNRGQSHMHGGVGSHIDNMLSGNGSMHTNITVEDCVFTGSENNSITAEGVNGFFVRNNKIIVRKYLQNGHYVYN